MVSLQTQMTYFMYYLHVPCFSIVDVWPIAYDLDYDFNTVDFMKREIMLTSIAGTKLWYLPRVKTADAG